MTDNLKGIIIRLGLFMTVCALALAATMVVFSQFRFGGSAHDYSAGGIKGSSSNRALVT